MHVERRRRCLDKVRITSIAAATLLASPAFAAWPFGVLRGAAELRQLERAGDAEAALSVEPSWQSHGVGTVLLERVLLAARNRKIERVHMLCLAENRPMQSSAFNPAVPRAEVEAPRPTPLSIMRELVADGTDHRSERT
jgi:GNAT superfamily N-acetyltransferase